MAYLNFTWSVMLIKQYPTCIGYTALVFWVLAAPFTVRIKTLPLFETLAIIFYISFSLSALKFSINKHWSRLKQPLLVCLIGFVGVYGNQLLYIASFKYAPAAHADLINYLWPILIILLTGFLPKEQLSIRHIIAACLGFSGVYVLLFRGATGFDHHYLLGYLLAFSGAVVWSVYSITARFFAKLPVEIIGLYCGLGCLCSLITHLLIETPVMPKVDQWGVLGLMGVTTQGLAYFFWDFGVKHGDFKRLSLLSYGNPILSIVMLILLGMAKPTLELLIACLLVTAGGFIGIAPWPFFNHLQFRRKHSGLTATSNQGADQSQTTSTE